MEEELELSEVPKEVNGLGIASLVTSIVGLLTTPCFGLGGLLSVIAIALGFVSFRKKTQKGFGIASIIIGIVGIVSWLIFAVITLLGGTGIAGPQIIKYNTKVNAANDQIMCDEVKIAMQATVVDICYAGQENTILGSLADDQYHDITKISNDEFRQRVEKNLGMSLTDAQKQVRGARRIHFKIDSNYNVDTQLQ